MLPEGNLNLDPLIEADAVDVSFLDIRLHPEMVHVENRHDRLAHLKHFALPRGANGDDAVQRRENFCVPEMHVRRGFIGARLLKLGARRGEIALLDVELLAVGIGHRHLRFRRANLIFQGLDGGIGRLHGRERQVAVLRGGHAGVK